jgi:glucan biosynthesis protein C
MTSSRLHALDAVRGFALLAGVVLHATMSFLPGFGDVGWPIADNSPSTALGLVFYVIHTFRMTLFFLLAGFFGHMLLERVGVRAFVRDRAKRIAVPLVVGWIVVFPLIVVAIVWAATMKTGTAPPPPPPSSGALSFPLTHLWFLYVLILLYVATLLVRWISRRVGIVGRITAPLRAAVSRAVHAPWAPVLLAAPLFAALQSHAGWVWWFGIPTPDQSLIPNLPAVAAFGTAFALGWFVHRHREMLVAWERQWPRHLLLAVGLTVVSLQIVGPLPSFEPTVPDGLTSLYAATYAGAAWCWTLALVGLALRFFAGESPVRRYVSDASYWIYVVHLPLLFFVQTAVMKVPLHWSLKFPALLVVSFALLFASYHLLVRFTFVGKVLNGRRHPRGSRDAAAPNAPEGSLPA